MIVYYLLGSLFILLGFFCMLLVILVVVLAVRLDRSAFVLSSSLRSNC